MPNISNQALEPCDVIAIVCRKKLSVFLTHQAKGKVSIIIVKPLLLDSGYVTFTILVQIENVIIDMAS